MGSKEHELLMGLVMVLAGLGVTMLMLFCVLRRAAIARCCKQVFHRVFCCDVCSRRSSVNVYGDLNDLLFDADGSHRAGRLDGDDREISVSNFFCDVLHTSKSKQRAQPQVSDDRSQQFIEPLI
mmetsp:Transcript_50902/g.76110  ORF Transcript_50902/g.76110 Transcript_50902/m.76110 type:complete len:124 (-) Transcript_50902:65-436(-)|eukprot:CAMPEP_0194046578 /NCGR_PEP_ID=MMETSP0009_2-20130614/21712_1 /TAXON_ID=210454 /ORGANISM="Grammatophora oceanica, Strain CCMP 410" /LENGTH=123 /DNA_ID=CAMNT_0038691933 /DNA_START=53 /DNA_END=424 /DNA_ORIENTATION=+